MYETRRRIKAHIRLRTSTMYLFAPLVPRKVANNHRYEYYFVVMAKDLNVTASLSDSCPDSASLVGFAAYMPTCINSAGFSLKAQVI